MPPGESQSAGSSINWAFLTFSTTVVTTLMTDTISGPVRSICVNIEHDEPSKIISKPCIWRPTDVRIRNNGQLSTNPRTESIQFHKEPGALALFQSPKFAALSAVFGFVTRQLHALTDLKKVFYDFVSRSFFDRYCLELLLLHFATEKAFQFVWEKSPNYKSMFSNSMVSRHLFVWITLTCCVGRPSLGCTDIRNDIADYECLNYDANTSTFSMSCSFAWTDNTTKCIVLRKNETFKGNGHSVDLNGVTNWEGLFRIATNENSPASLGDAPVIHDIHMMGGVTSNKGGFVIQAFQKHFIVKHCSSSGVIQGYNGIGGGGGGGICGQECSGDILIIDCWTSGKIGYSAGGIAGRELGINGDKVNTVTISHCYSTGDIIGTSSGGICGYFTGKNDEGIVIIEQCYSKGEIGGSESGGITGGLTADPNGHVSIINCYSRGNITGADYAGGICGANTGANSGTVILTNVYASGKIKHEDAGGLIGSVFVSANEINITMSVYNGDTGDMVGKNEGKEQTTNEKNSGELEDITGTVYCYDHNGGIDNTQKECWNNETIWQAVEKDFPIFIEKKAVAETTPTGTPSSHPTSSISRTPKETQTATPTSTRTGTNTKTNTPSHTASLSATVSRTSSQTGSLTPSPSSSETGTMTGSSSPSSSPSPTQTTTTSHSRTYTSTGTLSPSPTETVTSTRTVSSSETRSKTPNMTPSPSATPTSKRKHERMELPVQYPRRSVIMKRRDEKSMEMKMT